MYRVTTPTHVYTLPENASTYAEILVVYRQEANGKKIKIKKHYKNDIVPDGMGFDGKNVIIKLTQQETQKFIAGKPLEAQLRVLTQNGDSYASQRFVIMVEQVLSEDVLG